MPNWVENKVRISGDATVLAEVKAFLQGEDEFSFDKIIPEPVALQEYPSPIARDDAIRFVATHDDFANAPFTEKELEDAKMAIENIVRFGAPDWYSWRCKNWGTKWGACYLETSHSENELFYEFSTAWDWPEPIFQLLCSRFIDLRIEWDWHEETEVEYLDEDLESCRRLETWHHLVKDKGDDFFVEDNYLVRKED